IFPLQATNENVVHPICNTPVGVVSLPEPPELLSQPTNGPIFQTPTFQPIAGPIHSSPPHSPHQSGPLFSPPIDHSPPISTPILTPALDEDSTATGSSAPTDKDISTSPIVTCRRST
ncbi:unnamed protein product, partial [Ilex paraguariensis]